MKTKLSLLILGALLPAMAAHAQTTVTTSYSSGETVIYDTVSITTSGTVTISGTADVSFVSDAHVTLAPGFKVAVGATFRTLTDTDSDGDGMPNAWEAANGLNPAVNDANADLDGDTLTNLTEYQLGTNPNGSSSNDDDSTNTIGLKIQKPN